MLTRDPWILETVLGYRLELLRSPSQESRPLRPVSDVEKNKALDKELEKLKVKRAIAPVHNETESAQGGWLLEASYQSTFTKSVYCSPPFQDGGNTSSKVSNEKERLDGEIGSKRCVPFSTNVRAISEISPIRVVPTNMGIQLPTLPPKQCPVHFHKATETSSGSIEKVGDTMYFVSR